jgi:hypothetical protein
MARSLSVGTCRWKEDARVTHAPVEHRRECNSFAPMGKQSFAGLMTPICDGRLLLRGIVRKVELVGNNANERPPAKGHTMMKLLAVSLLALGIVSGCAHESAPTPQVVTTDARSEGRVAKAYLEITLKVDPANRAAAAAVYTKYKQPFLDTVPGAISKQLLVRDEDVVVLHGFDNTQHAGDYLKSALFTNDVVTALKPLLAANPDVRIYAAP